MSVAATLRRPLKSPGRANGMHATMSATARRAKRFPRGTRQTDEGQISTAAHDAYNYGNSHHGKHPPEAWRARQFSGADLRREAGEAAADVARPT